MQCVPSGASGSDGSQVCVTGGFQHCGAADEPCCEFNSCDNSGCCIGNHCTPDGGTCSVYGGVCSNGGCTGNQIACGSSSFIYACLDPHLSQWLCTAPFTFPVDTGFNIQCHACGRPGEPCCDGQLCAGGGCCAGGNFCVAQGTSCDPYGGVCNSGYCYGADGQCAPYGDVQPAGCGSSSQCGAPYSIGNETCGPCGGAGESCCEEYHCGAGYVCNGSSFSVGNCFECGDAGEPCCSGGYCATGQCRVDAGYLCP
jgi:hypothetical protein